MSNKKKVSSVLQGITHLIIDATIGITEVVEAMHKQILHPPFSPSTPIQHLITNIAGITYNNIKSSTQIIGKSADKALEQLSSVLGEIETTNEKEAIRSVLNGVVGDYLEKNENPLKITMQFKYQGKAIELNRKNIENTYPKVNGKILLMVHGSCLNDAQWCRKGHNHGMELANDYNKTPVYLNYNSGRHVSTNGQNLNELLENLILNWPVPVEELIIVAHSMGGLVARSAVYYGQIEQKLWPKYLKKIIFLGTPHHGAPLEHAGNYLEVILEAIPYARPIARLGKIRSAGVTDLRFGNLIDKDWENSNRFKMEGDKRQHISLPEKIECYSIAGSNSKVKETDSMQLRGDNLVGVKSALGLHNDPTKGLKFKKENTWIAYEINHTELLSSPQVYLKIKSWMD